MSDVFTHLLAGLMSLISKAPHLIAAVATELSKAADSHAKILAGEQIAQDVIGVAADASGGGQAKTFQDASKTLQTVADNLNTALGITGSN